jgi:hypothetical protein
MRRIRARLSCIAPPADPVTAARNAGIIDGCLQEIAHTGEHSATFLKRFTDLALISAAFYLDHALAGSG